MFATGHYRRRFDVVTVAASHGGLDALLEVAAGLPASFAVPVVVVLHRRDRPQDQLATVLGRRCALPVHVAEHGRPPAGGQVLIAPPSGVVLDREHGGLRAPEHTDARYCGDALFTSAADAYGPRVISVVLSGYLDDGARGVAAVKSRGGRVLVQSPASARATSMPHSALATGCADFALPPTLLCSALVALTMARGADELLRVTPPPWATLHPAGEPTSRAG